MTDSQGRVVSFKNAIIILTSNLGSAAVLEVYGDKQQVGACDSQLIHALATNCALDLGHPRCCCWVHPACLGSTVLQQSGQMLHMLRCLGMQA